jgi:hypothetical protein
MPWPKAEISKTNQENYRIAFELFGMIGAEIRIVEE